MTELEKAHARIEELEAQEVELCTLYGIAQAETGKLRADLEAIGAGGVSGPLMGASLAASAGSEPVAEMVPFHTPSGKRVAVISRFQHLPIGTKLYTHPYPPEGMEGWISVDERLPEPNVEVLCAGRGWGNSFVTACYYDDERREWYPINTHWTDSTGCAQYPTHWIPLPLPPTSAEGVEHE